MMQDSAQYADSISMQQAQQQELEERLALQEKLLQQEKHRAQLEEAASNPVSMVL